MVGALFQPSARFGRGSRLRNCRMGRRPHIGPRLGRTLQRTAGRSVGRTEGHAACRRRSDTDFDGNAPVLKKDWLSKTMIGWKRSPLHSHAAENAKTPHFFAGL